MISDKLTKSVVVFRPNGGRWVLRQHFPTPFLRCLFPDNIEEVLLGILEAVRLCRKIRWRDIQKSPEDRLIRDDP